MKYMTKYSLFGLIILFTNLGCEQRAKLEMADEVFAIPPTEQKPRESVERKLIKEGQLEFETDKLSLTRKIVFGAVDKYQGYISSDQEFKSSGRKTNTLVIRVPADDFDNLLKDATQGIEKFDRKEINVKDVTEEFLDVQARLKTKKELEIRYLDLLKQAKNVTEVLAIEKQIGELRSEIESVEGRLKYLQNKVTFSTLTMTFYESIPNETEFAQKFSKGFRSGWDNLIWFFVALTNVWPFILIGVGLIVGLRIHKRKK